tara:strand:+ start:2991 stop:4010 length:1020 start_codon:yes stop_codon:yes gene_type:complete
MIFRDITDTKFKGIEISSYHEFDHEKVYYYEDDNTGIKSLVAIHDSSKGPAIGGCRFKEYDSFEQGLNDVLRLSRGMTHKNNVAQIPFGGGKAIIFQESHKSDRLLKSYANFLNLLEGQYISAEDIGISLEDIRFIKKYTEFVFDNIDPGPYTAKGIYYVIKEAIDFCFSQPLIDKKISIQGAGSVGMHLAEHLANDGANVFISDIDKSKLENIDNPNINPIDDAFSLECDVFSPCALGAIFNESSIKSLNCKIIAGGANNQLQDLSIANALHNRDIIYIPDILINSGGAIGLTKDLMKRNEVETESDLMNIAYRVREALTESQEKSINLQDTIRELII